MKKIKFLIFLIVLSSCNQYLGTVDPDYTPTNEVTEIFSDFKNNNYIKEVKFGDIIFPKVVNSSFNINNLEIEKITNINKNSIVNFVNEKIFISNDETIYSIDKNNQNKFEYELNLNKDEEIISIFKFNENIHILTNRSRIFVIDGKSISEIADYNIFINTNPIILHKNLILLSVFGDIYDVKLDDYSILKKENFILNSGISVKSNLFEDKTNLYYLFNAGTLLTFDKNNFDFYNNYLLEDLNILTSFDRFSELIDTPFSYNEYLYFLDRSGKIAVYNPVSSDILWELDINDTIISYLFSNDGYLILMTFNEVLILSDNGNIINSYYHNKESPISIFNIQENLYLISEEGISKLNLNDKREVSFYKNKFTNNLEIYYQEQNIYLKDDKSLFKLSE